MIEMIVRGVHLIAENDRSLFSPDAPDRGTVAMLETIDMKESEKVLDLGCGWGLVGLTLAGLQTAHSLTLTDVNPTAVNNAQRNFSLNGFEGAIFCCGDAYASVPDRDYTLILSNPPYHTDFQVARIFIEKGFNRLATGGKMVMVTKRKEWYKNKFISIFGGVRITEQDGYYVFQAEKRSTKYAEKKTTGVKRAR